MKANLAKSKTAEEIKKEKLEEAGKLMDKIMQAHNTKIKKFENKSGSYVIQCQSPAGKSFSATWSEDEFLKRLEMSDNEVKSLRFQAFNAGK